MSTTPSAPVTPSRPIDSDTARSGSEPATTGAGSSSSSHNNNNTHPDNKTTTNNTSSKRQDIETISLIDISRQFREHLKYNKEEELCVAANKQPCVHFDSIVECVEISSHRDYPESARRLLWNSFQEIQSNAERNIVEFQFDQCDWRNASEELIEINGGELVHPASVKLLQQQQLQSQHGTKKRKLKNKKKTRLHRRKVRQYVH